MVKATFSHKCLTGLIRKLMVIKEETRLEELNADQEIMYETRSYKNK